jgi:antitoxin ParD1/3/4
MTITLTPEVEALIQKRLASGAFQNVDEVILRAIESQDAEEAWLLLHQREVNEKLDRAISQADRGECLTAEESLTLLERQKAEWRSEHGRF